MPDHNIAEASGVSAGSERAQNIRPRNRQFGLSLTRNFVWTFAGNLFYAACQWSIVVVLAKLGKPEVVGQYALALAIGFPVTFIANLQLRTLFVTDFGGKYPFYEMLGLRYVLSVIAIFVIVITCWTSGYDANTTETILIVGLAQIADCLSENYFGTFQRDERMDRITISLMMRHLLGASLLIAAVYFTHNLVWGAAGLVLGRASVLLLYDTRYGALDGEEAQGGLSEHLRPSWNLSNQLKMLWTALPLGVASILISVNSNSPRYVIEHVLGRRQLGIYSAISYIPAGTFMIATALGYAVFARMSKLFFEGNVAGFQKLLLKTGGICAAFGLTGFLGSALLGRQALMILYGREYAENSNLLLWLMVTGAVQCLTTCLGCALTAACQFSVQALLIAAVTATSLIASILFIPHMALLGAALAVLISAVVQLLGSGLLMFRAIQKRTHEMKGSNRTHFEAVLELER